MADDMQKGFESGCDDYIKKPFDLKELDLRINNIKRFFNISPKNITIIDEKISLDNENLMIINENKKIQITKKESEVLLYLIKNSSKIVSID